MSVLDSRRAASRARRTFVAVQLIADHLSALLGGELAKGVLLEEQVGYRLFLRHTQASCRARVRSLSWRRRFLTPDTDSPTYAGHLLQRHAIHVVHDRHGARRCALVLRQYLLAILPRRSMAAAIQRPPRRRSHSSICSPTPSAGAAPFGIMFRHTLVPHGVEHARQHHHRSAPSW